MGVLRFKLISSVAKRILYAWFFILPLFLELYYRILNQYLFFRHRNGFIMESVYLSERIRAFKSRKFMTTTHYWWFRINQDFFFRDYVFFTLKPTPTNTEKKEKKSHVIVLLLLFFVKDCLTGTYWEGIQQTKWRIQKPRNSAYDAQVPWKKKVKDGNYPLFKERKGNQVRQGIDSWTKIAGSAKGQRGIM